MKFGTDYRELLYCLYNVEQRKECGLYTDWTMGWMVCGLYSSEGKILLSPPNSAQSLLSSPPYLFNMYRRSFQGVKSLEREVESSLRSSAKINLLTPELFFLNFNTSVYKMWIIQEPNTL